LSSETQAPALAREDVARFIRDGFLRIEDAFPRDSGVECCRLVAARGGIDLADPSSWTQPVTRVVGAGDPVFAEVINTPKLRAAYDSIVGAGRWGPRNNVGLVVVRFPSEQDPGDAGWHIEASYAVDGEPGVNVFSRDRALLILMLLSDVEEHDAPTRVRVGSHLLVPAQLRGAGDEGVPFARVATDTEAMEACPQASVTGPAGTAYLCHPFLVHSATWPHRGATPRFMAQPGLEPSEPLEYERPSGEYSPVERGIRVGLGIETLDEAIPNHLPSRTG
jgi:hypothetical protein